MCERFWTLPIWDTHLQAMSVKDLLAEACVGRKLRGSEVNAGQMLE
jgi:hypothetical protein